MGRVAACYEHHKGHARFSKCGTSPGNLEVCTILSMRLSTTKDLGQLLHDLVGPEGPRGPYILLRRLGVNGQEPATLRTLGIELGITGERVRQLANRARNRIAARQEEYASLEDTLVEMLKGRGRATVHHLAHTVAQTTRDEESTVATLVKVVAYVSGRLVLSQSNRWVQLADGSAGHNYSPVLPPHKMKKFTAPEESSALVPLLTISEAANLLHLHPNTLRRWGNTGKITPYRIGQRQDRRFVREEVLALLEAPERVRNKASVS